MVWDQEYGRSEPCPCVEWVEGKDLDCHATDPDSGEMGDGFSELGGCRGGIALVPFWVKVAWPDPTIISNTSYAHELLHAAMMYDGKLFDHHDDDFDSKVDAANNSLKKRGM